MTNFLLIFKKPKQKRGVELCFDTPLCFFLYAPKFTHEKAGTGRRSKLHMHIIIPKRLLRFIGRCSPFFWNLASR